MWPKHLDQYQCPECQFEIWIPVAELEASVIGFYNDARFPGRCILAYKNHSTDLAELDDEERNAYLRDAVAIADAITSATGADRINYAVLGNVEPHLHMHIIPRSHSREPLPQRTPWEDPRPKTSLSPDEADAIVKAIQRELGLPLIASPGERLAR